LARNKNDIFIEIMTGSLKDMLSSNALGEKGQSRFKELCSDVDLICNKSDRDMAGWDFIVDFDLDESATTSLDRRKTPLSCHVQLKTIYSRTASVKLSLKMAERLAKELKPSFICVLKVNADLQFTAAYLIHMAGDRLSSILKRLREVGAKSSSAKIKKMTISFTPTEAERIEVSGSALRDAIVQHIGSDLHAYTEIKSLASQNMGYEGSPHEGRFEIDVRNLATFQDMFIGLTGEVEVKNFELTTTRFGITLPETASPTAKISLSAKPLDRCVVVFRKTTSHETAIFEGDVFFAPNMPGIERRIRVNCDLFSIFISLSKDGSEVSFKFDVKGKSCKLDVWSNYWKMMRVLDSKMGSVELKLASHANVAEIYVGNQAKLSVGLPSINAYVDICDKFAKILNFSGVKPDFLVSFISIMEAHQLIDFLVGMIDGTDATIYRGTVSATEEQSQSLRGDGLFVGKLEIDSLLMAYYARISVDNEFGDEICAIKATNFEIKKVRRIDDSEASFQDFIVVAKKAELIEIVLSVP
jgi:hypothetical protein